MTILRGFGFDALVIGLVGAVLGAVGGATEAGLVVPVPRACLPADPPLNSPTS